MANWWWLTLIMITVYKSSVLSAMVHPPTVDPDDLQQLIARGFRVAGNIHYQDVVKDLLDVNETVYSHALHEALYADGPCDTFALTLNGGVAMLDELSEIQYELRAICPQYNPGMVNDFRITRKPVRFTGHAWAVQKDAPYQQAINFYLSLILSGGLYKKWINDETAKGASKLFRKSKEITSYEAEMLSLQRFKPLLAIFIVGISLACLCFVVEMIYFYTQKIKIIIRNKFYKCLAYKSYNIKTIRVQVKPPKKQTRK